MTIQVLYVDNERALLEIGKDFLEMTGDVIVSVANSVDEAEKLIGCNTFDAIISDYKMPERSGMDFLKALRLSGNDIPFILFTGKGREEVVIDALNNGADYYIVKGGDAKSQFAELFNAVSHAVTRKKTGETLDHTSNQLRTMFENITDLLIELDEKGRISLISPSVKSLLGYEPDELIGKTVMEFLVKGDASLAKDKLEIVLGGQKAFSRYRVRAKDGREIWFSTSSSRYVCRGKARVIVSARDITEHMAMVEIMYEGNKAVQAFVEQSPDMVMMTDDSGKVGMVNPEACRRLEISSEQASSMYIWDLIHGYLREDQRTLEEYNYIKEAVQAGLETGRSPLFGMVQEMTLQLPAGGWFYTEMLFFPVKVDGKWKVVISIRDSTARRRSQKRDRLARRKEEVIGFVFSREISAQLKLAHHHIDLMASGLEGARLECSVEAMRRTCDRIHRVLGFLEQYEKVGIENPDWIGLKGIIDASAKRFDNVSISVDPAFNGMKIFADRNIGLVFDNIFENAVQHGGSVKSISVIVESTSAQMNIIISDDGQGFRDHTLKERQGGWHPEYMGLGLLLSEEILSVTDISIREKDMEKGHGAVFILQVPKVKMKAEAG
jgi:PAS domain S-box-containing protein